MSKHCVHCIYSLHFCVSLYNLPIYNIHISITSLPCLLFTNVFAPYWLYITALFFWECLSPSISIKHHRCLPFSYLCPWDNKLSLHTAKKSTTVGTHNKQDISTHIHSTQYSEVDDQELGNHKFRYERVYIKKKHNLVSLQCNAHMTPLSQSDSIFHSLPHT